MRRCMASSSFQREITALFTQGRVAFGNLGFAHADQSLSLAPHRKSIAILPRAGSVEILRSASARYSTGPTDVLLDLIRRQNIYIYAIPVDLNTGQFLEYRRRDRVSNPKVS